MAVSKNTRNAKTNDDTDDNDGNDGNDGSDGNDGDTDGTGNFDFDEFYSNSSTFETTDSFSVSKNILRSKEAKTKHYIFLSKDIKSIFLLKFQGRPIAADRKSRRRAFFG